MGETQHVWVFLRTLPLHLERQFPHLSERFVIRESNVVSQIGLQPASCRHRPQPD